MAQKSGMDFEQIDRRIPKNIADDFNKYITRIGKEKTYVLRIAIEYYLKSSISQIPVLEKKISQLEWDKRRLNKEVESLKKD